MTRIKLCGLKSQADIGYANAVKPDYIGFVFAPKSRRYVTPEQAAALRAKLDAGITPVGVFVDEPIENVAKLLSDGVIAIAQLHGSETEAYIRALRAISDAPIIKAFKIETPEDVFSALNASADYILLDGSAGGTGKAFDWSIIGKTNRPFFLAGGLSPENVAQAISLTHPYAVDVSSGVETGGEKDFEKIKRFENAVGKD